MGKWIWDELTAELQSFYRQMHAMTLTGLHLGANRLHPDIRLETHVLDVIHYIEKHNLTNTVLVSHSYSGVVAGQVADRIPEAISRLIFIEAILPIDGYTMLESGGNDIAAETKLIAENNGLWPHPTADELSDEAHLNEEQRQYLLNHFVDHPGKTVTDPAIINNSVITIPSLFIGARLPDTAKISAFKDLKYAKLDGGHWPMLTKPKELAKILNREQNP